MKLEKSDRRGKVYQADGFKIIYRKAGTISGDNSENREERIYLVSGRAVITLKGRTWEADSPEEILFPANTHHKIEAITDISFILFGK